MNTQDFSGVLTVDDAAVLELASRLIGMEGHQDLPNHEAAVAQELQVLLSERFAGRSVDITLQPVATGRFNLILGLSGDRPGPTLMFNAHLDTVPGYAMPRAYTPEVRDGRLYGRGAVDMKGAMAAMVHVLDVFSAPDVSFAGRIVVSLVAGEESGSQGMQAYAPTAEHVDFAIVGEPTGMAVARAHKGAMWLEASFTGKATHGSVPHEGINAVEHAARFICLLADDLAPRLTARRHPVLGSATLNVGVVRGGDRPPMVPAACSVQIDRRWLPSETHAEVIAEFQELLDRMASTDPTVVAHLREMDGTADFVHTPLECPEGHPALALLCDVVSEMTGQSVQPIGVNFWTDAALFSTLTGTPTVVCGPGDIAQAHSLDEWIALDQLAAAARIYTEFATRLTHAHRKDGHV